MPQNRSFGRAGWGTWKYPKIRRKTKRLSSDSERSMR